MNTEDVRKRLRKMAAALGSQQALAKSLGVSTAYLSDVLNERRQPGPTILSALGLTPETTYRRTV